MLNDAEPSAVPPEAQISHLDSRKQTSEWLVVAKNKRIKKDWDDLCRRCPENSEKCFEHLKKTPFKKLKGRIFPLRGKKYKGVWEYEVTGSDRVFYIPHQDPKKVVVYYAGAHPKKKAPEP